MLSAPERIFESSQFIPRPIGEVFSFFSNAQNLERLTPSFLRFKILYQSTEKIQAGTIFDYRLRIHGLPIKWRTEILEWEENKRFVDNQVYGPYTKWHHTHTFAEKDGGTFMTDRVIYKVPLGWLGDRLLGSMVRRDIQSIFDYRRQQILELF